MVSRGLFFAALLAMCGTAQAAIRTKTSDTDGVVATATGAFALQVMPPNIPSALNAPTAAVASTGYLLTAAGSDGFVSVPGASAVQDTIRISSNSIKMYVSAYDDAAGYASGGDINDANYDSTFTLYYSINGGATVTIGTYTSTQVLASTPFIFLDNIADGSYTIRAWAQVNAKSNTKVSGTDAIGTKPLATEIAADNTDAAASPLTLTVIVDTTKPVTTITTAMSAYSNSATGTIGFTCSKAATANPADATPNPAGGYIEFWVSFAGSAYALNGAAVNTNGFNSQTYTYNLAGKTDGSYTFSVYCKWIGYEKTDINIRQTTPQVTNNGVNGEAGLASYVETTTPKPSLTWFYDTTAPVVAVQAGPGVGGAASLFAYGAGTTSFTFSCTDENGLACTYKCALDGKATSNGASTSTASKGYYSCTSGHTITLAAGETTTFHVYAVDLAGNESPLSPMYAYSNDNTAPLVAFTNMDTSATLATATQTSNALDSGYYPTAINAPTAATTYLSDGTTAIYERAIGATTGGEGVGVRLNTLDDATPTITTDMLYRTVLQVPIDTTDPVYDLTNNGSRGATDGYGVMLAARQVNGVTPTGVTAYGAYYYNALLSTNAPSGTFTFTCVHSEMKNGDSAITIAQA